MKRINKIFLVIILGLLTQNCSTIKEGFSSQKKNSTDEFLVEKKSPLVMPPNYNELPIPGQEKNMQENKKSDIKSLISGSDNQQEQSADNNESISSIEKLILKEIKKN